jgi:hypothetical protein
VPPPPLTCGDPKLTEAAAELVMSSTSPLRAEVAPPPLPAVGACIGPEADGARPPAPPSAPIFAVSLFGIEALP